MGGAGKRKRAVLDEKVKSWRIFWRKFGLSYTLNGKYDLKRDN